MGSNGVTRRFLRCCLGDGTQIGKNSRTCRFGSYLARSRETLWIRPGGVNSASSIGIDSGIGSGNLDGDCPGLLNPALRDQTQYTPSAIRCPGEITRAGLQR
ncbi:MAG: hypothetical protein IIB77_05410 [Proteobacteria bacterium]|nr:hypothetical protein [Pseudomonadota bacterium]